MKKKKLLTLFTTLCMALMLFPVTAFAYAEPEPTPTPEATPEPVIEETTPEGTPWRVHPFRFPATGKSWTILPMIPPRIS